MIVAIIKDGFINESNIMGTIISTNTKTTNIDIIPPIKYIFFIIKIYLIANAVKWTPSIAGSSDRLSSFELISDNSL